MEQKKRNAQEESRTYWRMGVGFPERVEREAFLNIDVRRRDLRERLIM